MNLIAASDILSCGISGYMRVLSLFLSAVATTFLRILVRVRTQAANKQMSARALQRRRYPIWQSATRIRITPLPLL